MKSDTVNTILAMAAIALSVLAAGWFHGPQKPAKSAAPAKNSLSDHRGNTFPLIPYTRIVSASTTADQVLSELVPKDRVVAVTTQGQKDPQLSAIFDGKPTITSLDDVEKIVSLKPDIILANNLLAPKRLARLQEAGIPVFDLGPTHGVNTLLEDIKTLGLLFAQETKANAIARNFAAKLHAAGRGCNTRLPALYVDNYGGKLFGGGQGSSFHDVLEAACVEDIAGATFGPYPQFEYETLFRLAPSAIVTRAGSNVCDVNAIKELDACKVGRIIELPGHLISDPGLKMAEAALALREEVEDLKSE